MSDIQTVIATAVVKICRYLLTVLLLTMVALSTSDVLPILSIKQLGPIFEKSEEKANDYTLNDRLRNNDIANDMFYKVSITPSHNTYTPVILPQKSDVVYVRDQRNVVVDGDNMNKNSKYDDEGYRKNQWHNYPRQLDSLQKYLDQQHEFDTDLNPETDDPDEIIDNTYELVTNDIQRTSDSNGRDIVDAVVAATSPLLILKIRLACLKNDQNDYDDYANNVMPIEIVDNNFDDNKDPGNVVKVKREGIRTDKGLHGSEETTDSKKIIKKRIFSLWSRLQSLSHKGHELHHRRHLHALYGFPDDDGSGGGTGTLTAETRASFIRPPGSPLRWG